MATQWYCDLMGKVVGPMTSADLLKRVRKGDIRIETLIRKDNSRWFPAGEVGGLFQAAFENAPRGQQPPTMERDDDYDY